MEQLAENEHAEMCLQYLQSELTPTEEKNFEEHIDACKSCQTMLQSASKPGAN